MSEMERAAGRPRLALVLGSGGVRSVAALGIAGVLAREGLAPELVVGCSSGALFGACIASGMPSEESLAAATKLWSAELTEKRRWRAYAELLLPGLMGFGPDFSLRDAHLISARIEQAFGWQTLESLPTSLRVVATEAATGERVVLTQGLVSRALLASMALPFIFPSVEIDGRRLTDGVISDPLPVSVADDAHAVIALGFHGAMPRRIDRPGRLVAQATTAMINNLQHAQLRAARAAGQRVLCLELELDRRIGLWETRAMPRIFEAGQRAAEARLPEIRAMCAQNTLAANASVIDAVERMPKFDRTPGATRAGAH
jgi:NTE family protein